MAKSARPALDQFDRRLLALVQANARLTHEALGERIGLSASAVRRRLNALRDAGVIEAEVALVDPEAFGVTVIVTLSFHDETEEAYDALDAQLAASPHVQQSYHVAGEHDYVVIVHGPSLRWYETWARGMFMRNPALRRYSSQVVWSRKKFAPHVEV